MAELSAALDYLSSLSISEKPNYTKVAQKYGCDRNTLSRRHRRVQGTRDALADSQRLLNSQQETELLQYIDGLCERGLPPTKEMIRNFASEIAGKPAGKNWVDRFIRRHKVDLLSHWTSGIDASRKRADSAFKYALYFELLRKKIEQYNVDKRHMYNMDEKGFLIGVLSKMKRVFSRQRYESGGIKQMLQDGNREWITTLACICADGSSLTPCLIYQAQSNNIQDTWLQDFNDSSHKALFAVSPSGWTNNDLGLAWVKQVFDRETKAKARRDYRLLLLDGHRSHVTMEFINYCDQNKILLAIYPPHSTHTLQPLDVALFKPLSTAYSAELTEYLDKCQGLSRVTKRDFFAMFERAWQCSFQENTICSAFKATGLVPFNPQVILQRFNNMDPERPSSSDSSSSVLSASDWRKIERLLRQVVADTYAAGSRQLSRTMHSISVRNALLNHENKRLREALAQKKRPTQGKPLLLEPPTNYAGGAMFWSPTKVKEARQRQAQKDQEAKAKEQEKEQRKAIQEERRRTKAIQKEERAQGPGVNPGASGTKSKAPKGIQEAPLLLQNTSKVTRKGKEKAITPPLIDEEDVEYNFSSVVDVAPTPARTRRGRSLRLPERYRT